MKAGIIGIMKKSIRLRSLLLIIIAGLLCISCGSNNTAIGAVEKYFESLKSGDSRSAEQCSLGSNGKIEAACSNQLYGEYISELLNGLSYSIISSYCDDDSSEINYVEVEVYYTDATDVFKNTYIDYGVRKISDFVNSDSTYTDFKECFEENYSAVNLKAATKRFKIKVVKDDDTWKVVYDDTLDEITSCGISTLERSLLDILGMFEN